MLVPTPTFPHALTVGAISIDRAFSRFVYYRHIQNTCPPIVHITGRERIHLLVAVAGL